MTNKKNTDKQKTLYLNESFIFGVFMVAGYLYSTKKENKKKSQFTKLDNLDYIFTLNPNYLVINTKLNIKQLLTSNEINNTTVGINNNIILQDLPLGNYFTWPSTIVYISVQDETVSNLLHDQYSNYTNSVIGEDNAIQSFVSVNIITNFSGNFEDRIERLFYNYNVGHVKSGIGIPSVSDEYHYKEDDFVLFLKQELSNSNYSQTRYDNVHLQPLFQQKGQGTSLWIKTKKLDKVLSL